MEKPRDLVVVKLGGATANVGIVDGVRHALERHSLLIVHGGGRTLTDWLARSGIESEFVGGLRATNDAALDVALAVLGGLVSSELVAGLRQGGVDAVGLTGIDGGMLQAVRRAELGRVGRIASVRTELAEDLIGQGFVPVVAPLALDEAGEPCNVNADEVAAALAAALSARLILLTDTDGVLDANDERIPEIDAHHATALIESGVIVAGMMPKIRGALEALQNGAREVVIADGRAPRALQRALADADFGTRVRS